MTSRCRAALPGLLAVAVVLSACGGGGEGEAAASSTSSSTTSESTSAPATSSAAEGGAGSTGEAPPDTEDDAAQAGPFPANTDPDTGYPSADARVTITALRVGRHDGFDRVVFEAGGTGTPGWDVRYVDAANSQGSGADIEVAGGAVLQVTLTGVGLPTDTGVEEYSGPDRLTSADAQAVTEVVWDGTFEGQSVAFVGVTEETPFRVYSLKGPARVVVEVADPS